MDLLEKIKQAVGDTATIEQKDGVISVTPKKLGRYRPEMGDRYFAFNHYRNLRYHPWEDDSKDGYNLITGSVHRTKEEAKQWLQDKRTKFEILEEIERLNDGWEVRFDEEHKNWTIYLSALGEWDCSAMECVRHPHGIYLKSPEACEELIVKFGDKLKVLFNPYI